MAKKNKKGKKESTARRMAKNQTSGFVQTVYRPPENMGFFSIKSDGNKLIDLIPFTAGKDNPNCDEGELHFERSFYSHRVGQGKETRSYVCPSKTYGRACPICEHLDNCGDDQLVKDHKAKHRQLFLVYDRSDEDKGVCLWEVSYHLFGKTIDQTIDASDEEDEVDWFYDPEKGKSLKIVYSEQAIGGTKFSQIDTILFRKRKPLREKLLKQSVCLDDILIEESYDKLKKLFLKLPDEDSKKSKGKKKKKDKGKKKKKDDIPF